MCDVCHLSSLSSPSLYTHTYSSQLIFQQNKATTQVILFLRSSPLIMTSPQANSATSNDKEEPNMKQLPTRKLKALIITMGSTRKALIEEMFAQHFMEEHFEPLEFSQGVPSRDLRNRWNFLTICNECGLIPEEEWHALQLGQEDPHYQKHPEQFFECLKDVPVKPGRRGSSYDVTLHYSVELWRKAKTVNRGRAVLGCTLAHLIALKRYFAEDFDIILEDNVRVPMKDCATRIGETRKACLEWEQQQQKEGNMNRNGQPQKCHLRFLGWLGSIPNLQWILERHTQKRAFQRQQQENNANISVVPFPLTQEIEADLREQEEENPTDDNHKSYCDNDNDNDEHENDASAKTARKPGGTPVWGSYAYWMSEGGYKALLTRLQNDVGALLWKGKRMRYYSVKPADKVLPRVLMEHFGQEAVQLSTHPGFFRAPMLTSKIHTQWDPEFCKSTMFQLQRAGGLGWADLWLSEDEREIIRHYETHGDWITVGKLHEMKATNADDESKNL